LIFIRITECFLKEKVTKKDSTTGYLRRAEELIASNREYNFIKGYFARV